MTKMPTSATACNCTVCRRYGALWAYGHEGGDISMGGTTSVYTRDVDIAFHFCPTCGCLTYYRGQQVGADGLYQVAINLRMADDPDVIADLPIRHFDGLQAFESLGQDHRHLRDMWF